MRKIWKQSCAILASVALVLGILGAEPVQSVHAQETKPFVVASLASSDVLLSDLLYLTEAAGVGDFGRLAVFMASPYTATLDRARPSGMYATLTEDNDLRVVSFLPVKDLKMLLATLEAQIGRPENLGGGVLRVAGDRPQPMYVKEVDGWVYVTNRREQLNDLPKDPMVILDGLDKEYTFALRVNVGSVPAAFREMVVRELELGFEDRVAQELDAAQAEVLRRLGGTLLQSAIQVVQETKHMTVGWKVDKAGKRTYLDVSSVAVEGTDLAKQMGMIQNATSSFAGFLLPDAAVTVHAHGQSSETEVAQATAMLEQYRGQALRRIEKDRNLANDDERQTAKAIVNELWDLAVATIQEAKMDVGAALLLKSESLSFVAGGFVADGEKLAGTVKKLADFAAQKEPNFPRINFDAETYQGVTFHTTRLPLRRANNQIRAILGDPMELIIGTGKQSAYVAFGKDPNELLKNVLDLSSANRSKELPPSQVGLSLSRILSFVASVRPDPRVRVALETLEDHPDSEGISLTAIPVPNGFMVRLELEEGVIRAIGGAAMSVQQP